VIKGYNAEAREEHVFSAGIGRFARQYPGFRHCISLMSTSSTVLMGLVSAAVMLSAATEYHTRNEPWPRLVSYTAFLAFLVAPVFQSVNVGSSVNEALAGLERTRDILKENIEKRIEADQRFPRFTAKLNLKMLDLRTTPEKPVLHDRFVRAQPEP